MDLEEAALAEVGEEHVPLELVADELGGDVVERGAQPGQHRAQDLEAGVVLEPDRREDGEVDGGVGVGDDDGARAGQAQGAAQPAGEGTEVADRLGLDALGDPVREGVEHGVDAAQLGRQRPAALDRGEQDVGLVGPGGQVEGGAQVLVDAPRPGEHHAGEELQLGRAGPAGLDAAGDRERLELVGVDVLGEDEDVVRRRQRAVQGRQVGHRRPTR